MPNFHLLETIIRGIQLDTRGQLNPLLYFPNVLQIKLLFFLEALNSKRTSPKMNKPFFLTYMFLLVKTENNEGYFKIVCFPAYLSMTLLCVSSLLLP